MRKLVAAVLAFGMLASAAHAALADYTGRGVNDPSMRVSFKLSSTKVRSFKAGTVRHECSSGEEFRSGFTLPSMVIRPDRTFGFSVTEDFGAYTGTVLVRGRILRGGNVRGLIKEKRVYEAGDVCRTGREPFRARPG